MAGIVFLQLLPDIRYLMPVTPLLCLLAARPFSFLSHRFLKTIILGGCLFQLLATAFYVFQTRQISPALLEGFHVIEKQLPPKALVLYPELAMLEYGNHRVVWGLFATRTFFWGTEEERIKEMARIHLDYIAVKKSRIYEDRGKGFHHIGAYPQSFLDRLPTWPFVSRIYENKEMSIWEIDYHKLASLYPALVTSEKPSWQVRAA